MRADGDHSGPDSRGMIIAVVVLSVVIIAAGLFFYQSEEQQVTHDVTMDLTAISELKAGQLVQWREDRLYDARMLMASRFFIEGADSFLAAHDASSRENLLSRFREMNTSPQYRNILLTDPRGEIQLSLDPDAPPLDPSTMAEVAESLSTGQAVITRFHRVPGTEEISLFVIAPLSDGTNESRRNIGAVLFSVDLDDTLYPFIQSWPVPSASAETLLVEREGDHVLFLNNLRHQNDTALNLTIPLSETTVPAVMAVLGKTGASTGRDYRGVDVISILGPVPGSPWYLVTKMDTAEAFASWRTWSGFIIIIVAVTLVGGLVIVALIWQRRQKYYYRSLYKAETEQREADRQVSDRMEALAMLGEMGSASDEEMVRYILDAACRLTKSQLAFAVFMNADESAVDVTIWSTSAKEEDLVTSSPAGVPVDKAGIWADAVRQRKPQIVNDYAAPRTEKTGLQDSHPPVRRFIAVPVLDGTRITMACAVANKESGYTVQDLDTVSLLMQGVWNNVRKRRVDEALRLKNADLEAAYAEITATEEELRVKYEELTQSERELRRSEQRLRQFHDSGLFGMIFWTVDGKITDANDTFFAMTGYTRADLEDNRINWTAMTPPEFRRLDEKSLEELRTTGINHVPFEKEYFRKNGTRLPVLVAGAMLDERRLDGVAFVLDISALKQAERALRENEARLSLALEVSRMGTWELEIANHMIRRSRRYDQIFGYDSILPEWTFEMFLEHVLQEDREMVERRFREAILEKSDWIFDCRIRRQDGVIRWITTRGRAEYDDGGRPVRMVGIVQDITVRKQTEQALRDQDAFTRAVLDNLPLGIAVNSVDPTIRFEYMNDNFPAIYRISREDVADPDTFWEAVYKEPSLRETIRKQVLEDCASGDPSRMHWEDIPLVREGEPTTYVEAQNVPIPDRGLMISMVWDITERKKAVESERETNEYLQNLIDYANAPIIVWDPQFRITRFNHAFERLTGCRADRVLGQTVDILFPPETRERSMTYLRQAAVGERWETVEIPILRRDGSQRTVLWNSATLHAIDGKTVIATIAQGQDITERKLAEEEMRSANAFLDMVIDMSPFAMWISDSKGTVIRVNRSLCQTINLPQEIIVGKYNVLCDQNLEAGGVMPDVRAVFEKNVPARFSIPWKAADAGEVNFEKARDMYIDVSMFPILNLRGELTYVVCQWVDITERREAERQREVLIRDLELKNAELERFTYTVSHDLKSPLITIRGFADLLEGDALSGDRVMLRKDVHRITSAADTMQQLLSDVLELSRIGRIISPPEKISLSVITREAVDLLAAQIAERAATVEIDPDLPEVYVDHTRIREVMVNLIENAIKYAGDRSDPRVRIGIDRSGDSPVFFVQDNGIGINPRYLERIFNLFEKLDPATPGSGAGLTIVKRIIETHGGRIWAESEGPGKGTTFKFRLPVTGTAGGTDSR